MTVHLMEVLRLVKRAQKILVFRMVSLQATNTGLCERQSNIIKSAVKRYVKLLCW